MKPLNPRAKLGQIHVYTGGGKGKTTAGLGLAIRATGAGKKTAIVYFDKGGDFYSERKILKKIRGLDIFPTGLVRFRPGTPFRFGVTSADKREALRGLAIVERLFKKKYDVIVMDEINSTTALKMVSERRVLALIKKKPTTTELVMTGRNAPASFIKAADLVTEMVMRKHYFMKGIPAREGIEF